MIPCIKCNKKVLEQSLYQKIITTKNLQRLVTGKKSNICIALRVNIKQNQINKAQETIFNT